MARGGLWPETGGGLYCNDYINSMEKPAAFYFWDKSSVSEIDLVISTQGLTIPVEIKYSRTWDKNVLQAIRMFKENHREKNLEIPFSLIIYKGEFMASLIWAFAPNQIPLAYKPRIAG